MGLIVKPHTFAGGTSALAAEVNSDFDTIYAEFNGNIEAANIAVAGVETANLAALACTNPKIDVGAITADKIALNALVELGMNYDSGVGGVHLLRTGPTGYTPEGLAIARMTVATPAIGAGVGIRTVAVIPFTGAIDGSFPFANAPALAGIGINTLIANPNDVPDCYWVENVNPLAFDLSYVWKAVGPTTPGLVLRFDLTFIGDVA